MKTAATKLSSAPIEKIRRILRNFATSLLITLLFASLSTADVFDVTLGGFDPATGTQLGVSGQITVDFSSPLGPAFESSNLTFSVDGETTQLTNNPFVSTNAPTSLIWETDGLGNLFITRLDDAFSQINFSGSTGAVFRNFDLGSGSVPHRLSYSSNITSRSAIVILEAASGPDGPNGFLVGTSTVPEPSSSIVLGVLCLAGLLHRNRT